MAFLGRFSVVILLFLVAELAMASPLVVRGGKVHRWARSVSNPTITYYIDSTLDSVADETRTAIALWTNVATSYITLVETTDQASADLTFRSNPDSETLSLFNKTLDDNGDIIVGEFVMETQAFDYSAETYISFMAHETGHMLGLGHSLNEGAIMSYRRRSSNTLSIDDRFAITRIYPIDGTDEYPLGCATVYSVDKMAGPGNRTGGSPFASLSLLFLICFLLKRVKFTAEPESAFLK